MACGDGEQGSPEAASVKARPGPGRAGLATAPFTNSRKRTCLTPDDGFRPTTKRSHFTQT